MAEAKIVYEKVGNMNAQASCSFNIANIHLVEGRYEEAMAAYDESLEMIENLVR